MLTNGAFELFRILRRTFNEKQNANYFYKFWPSVLSSVVFYNKFNVRSRRRIAFLLYRINFVLQIHKILLQSFPLFALSKMNVALEISGNDFFKKNFLVSFLLKIDRVLYKKLNDFYIL